MVLLNKLRSKKIYLSATGHIALLVLLSVLPMYIFMIINSIRLLSSTQNSIILSLQNTANTYMYELDNRMEKSDLLIYNLIQTNVNSMKLQHTDYGSDYINARYRFFWNMEEIRSIYAINDGMFLFMPIHDDILLSLSTKYHSQLNDFRNLLRNNDLSIDNSKWHLITMEENTFLIRFASQKNIIYGSIINVNDFISEIVSTLPYNSRYAQITEGLPMKNNAFLQVSATSKFDDIVLTISSDRNEILRIPVQFYVNLSFILLFIGFLPILFILLHRYLIIPIKTLNEAHRQLELGNRQYRIDHHAYLHEFQSAYKSFNEMANNIELLQIKNLENDLKQKEMELYNLQLQIRPHFLHNTFNLLYSLAAEKQFFQIQDILIYLSDYFRKIYHVDNPFIAFSEEEVLIKAYIKTASVRYPDQIEFICQIDPEIELMPIPPLLIHNFIENVIAHAIIPNRKIHITLFASYDDDWAVFEISDDGCGMNSEMVDIINNVDFVLGSTEQYVGLQNTIRRLNYYYNYEAKLTVESIPMQGSLFTVTIPYHYKEEIT